MEKSLSLSGSGTTTSKAESVRIPRTEEFYRKIYQQVAAGIAITDWQGVFQECNRLLRLARLHRKQLRTINFLSLIHPEDPEANLVQVRRLQVGEIPSFVIENGYIHKNGEPVWNGRTCTCLGEFRSNRESRHEPACSASRAQ